MENKDWTGNKKTTFVTLGASNHSDKDRVSLDYYATEPNTIDILIRDGGVTFNNPIWECCAGDKFLSNRLEELGCTVYSTDIIERKEKLDEVIDFFDCSKMYKDSIDIVTNFPYKFIQRMTEHALELLPDGGRLFSFAKLTFLEGKARKSLFINHPPKTLYVFSKRVKCAANGNFDEIGGNAVAYGWYEWEKGYKGDTIIKWIN